MPFGVVLVPFVAGDFLFALTGVLEAGEDFSAGAGSLSFCSFSLCFSSLGGAENQGQNIKDILKYIPDSHSQSSNAGGIM